MSHVAAGMQYALGAAIILLALAGTRQAVRHWHDHGAVVDRLADETPLPGEADPVTLLYATDLQAALATARAAHHPGNGRAFADHLRKRCKTVPDADLAWVVLVTLTVARHHVIRQDATPVDALTAILTDLAGAAVELTSIERTTEVPQ